MLFRQIAAGNASQSPFVHGVDAKEVGACWVYRLDSRRYIPAGATSQPAQLYRRRYLAAGALAGVSTTVCVGVASNGAKGAAARLPRSAKRASASSHDPQI